LEYPDSVVNNVEKGAVIDGKLQFTRRYSASYDLSVGAKNSTRICNIGLNVIKWKREWVKKRDVANIQ
jgi:hypothetical protein